MGYVRRCKHGVYIPQWETRNDYSSYCSGCEVPEPLPQGGKLPETRHIPLPYGESKCPKCGSLKFKYESEWDFSCPSCGFNALD